MRGRKEDRIGRSNILFREVELIQSLAQIDQDGAVVEEVGHGINEVGQYRFERCIRTDLIHFI